MLTYTELSTSQMLHLLATEYICQFGTMNPNIVEIVPMFYIFTYEDDVLNIYFITAESGQKMDNMKETGIVCVALNHLHCQSYESVVANGTASFVTNPAIQNMIIEKFEQKYGEYRPYVTYFNQQALAYVKVSVTQLTGRRYFI